MLAISKLALRHATCRTGSVQLRRLVANATAHIQVARSMSSSIISRPTVAPISRASQYDGWMHPAAGRAQITQYGCTQRHNTNILKRTMATAPSHSGVEAIRYHYFEDDARQIFRDWCRQNTAFSRPPAILSIQAIYVPFWTFKADVTVRTGVRNTIRLRRIGQNGPALMVYAGSKLPRVMAEVLKSDVNLAKPFSADMLEAGHTGSVDIEPYTTYESTAWAVARERMVEHERELHSDLQPQDVFTFEHVESRRILMPAFVVEYKYLTATFRVIINGATGDAFGIQQQPIFGDISKALNDLDTERITRFLRNFVGQQSAQSLNSLIRVLAQLMVIFIRPLAKIIFWPPFFVGAMFAVGGYVLTRGTYALRQQRQTFIEWEETRKAEMKAQATMTDEWKFRPTGANYRDRAREREQEEHVSGENYARRETARKSDGSAGATTQKKREFKKIPPVNENDNYDILGIFDLGPRATAAEIQAAFRRELMKYHPDHQGDASPYSQEDCSDRTRLIIKAYGELRDPNKRAVYDRSYKRGRRV